jgi:hypothetical protein
MLRIRLPNRRHFLLGEQLPGHRILLLYRGGGRGEKHGHNLGVSAGGADFLQLFLENLRVQIKVFSVVVVTARGASMRTARERGSPRTWV